MSLRFFIYTCGLAGSVEPTPVVQELVAFGPRFDIFLMTTSLSDIVMQLAGVVLDLEGTSLLRFCRLIRLVRIIKAAV